MLHDAGTEYQRAPVEKVLQLVATDRMKQLFPKLRAQMRFHDLLRSPFGRFLPTSTTERKVYAFDELLERVNRLRLPRQAFVDRLEDRRRDRLGFSFAHLRTTTKHFGPTATTFPIAGNPHAMTPVFPNLQAAFLKTFSTQLFASFLRRRR